MHIRLKKLPIVWFINKLNILETSIAFYLLMTKKRIKSNAKNAKY